MKKTWIKIKRGLLEPKHRVKLGIRIWLYLYILDQANWDTGEIKEWTDKNAADQLEMPISTVRKQRLQLQDDEYISCEQNRYSQRIIIKNWVNPREYSGKVINESTQNLSPSIGKAAQGTHQGTHKDNQKEYTQMGTPTSNSHITDHYMSPEWKEITQLWKLSPDCYYTMLKGNQQTLLPEFLKENPNRCLRIAKYYANMGKSFIQSVGMILNKFDTWDAKNEKKEFIPVTPQEEMTDWTQWTGEDILNDTAT